MSAPTHEPTTGEGSGHPERSEESRSWSFSLCLCSRGMSWRPSFPLLCKEGCRGGRSIRLFASFLLLSSPTLVPDLIGDPIKEWIQSSKESSVFISPVFRSRGIPGQSQGHASWRFHPLLCLLYLSQRGRGKQREATLCFPLFCHLCSSMTSSKNGTIQLRCWAPYMVLTCWLVK